MRRYFKNGSLKPIPEGNKGLPNLPKEVRKEMGYMKDGGRVKAGDGLYANIHKKKARIAAGSGEKMRKVGAKGAPTAQNFKDAAKTAKKT
jgi:hypothetical protein